MRDLDPAPSRAVRFGVFELDLRTGELRKRGCRVHLQEQPFQVLAALIERAGDLVTRDELRRRLWPDAVFVDFDQGLNKAVTKIRTALGDSAESPRFVETLERRGYRFVASVELLPDAPPTVREGPAMAYVVHGSTRIALPAGRHIVGRDPAAAVWLDSPVISRHHAAIVVADGAITIEDLASRNGTFVSGERIAGTVTLVHGSEIHVGPARLAVYLASSLDPTETEPLE